MFKFIGNRLKKGVHTVGQMADVSSIKQLFNYIQGIFNKIFRYDKNAKPETFEQAVRRLKLSPVELEARKKMFRTQVLIYSLGAIAIGCYFLYLVINGFWISALPTLVMVIFLVVHALRSHFWLFQVKQQKLGCTMHEWLNASIKESK